MDDLITLNNKIINKEINIDDLYQDIIKKIKLDPFNAIAYERIDKALFELNEYIYGKSKSEEERNNRWNDLIISMHYPLDLLTTLEEHI